MVPTFKKKQPSKLAFEQMSTLGSHDYGRQD
jgi:hypothetical protein